MALHPGGGTEHDPARSAQPQAAPLTRPSIADRLDDALLKLDLLRDRPLTSLALALVAVAVALGGWWLGRPPASAAVETAIPLAEPLALPATTTTELPQESVVVHVAGAVVAPGIVELPAGSRIVDAIGQAQGPTDEADLHQLNLAAVVSDGMQIRVPVPGEVVPPNGSPTSPDGSASGAGRSGVGPIDLNRATSAELQELHGIGPALARAIVDWRAENGLFAGVDDLLRVPGIGPAKLDALAEHVVV